MSRIHLDTDFLLEAASTSGVERRRLLKLVDSDAEIGMSAVAWYEFSRGPRTPEELALVDLTTGETRSLSPEAFDGCAGDR